ncbi:hypothetical protein RRG08_028637 [Elysia crispata]|uniref:HD domain-containing protein n=1 Tax=Elysia crispata TaxID=231223 RepID=A0AAE1DKX8_9GAST|nr:hypothetical protein RRG08_028637 [Elysia crispata]
MKNMMNNLFSEIDVMDNDSSQSVTINDCVHGHIQLSRDLIKIVDTPQIQRLRDLKQLGLASYVYPGATHTRFAHCIGVCHLAGTFMRQLYNCQPELGITERDIFCVQVAGLCHDLGHGPFSHMFEEAVKEGCKKDWRHEQASLKLFAKMVEDSKLGDLFQDGEINFIKELIHSKEGQRTGRNGGEENKEFLYEIISNERTGIDVDKFDYFARDCHALGFSNMFDHKRFMLMARVLRCEDNKLHICYKDKELENLIVMFQTRFTLHLFAYKHSVVSAVDKMVCDAFLHADEYILTQGDDNEFYSLTKSIENMGAFGRLSDSVLHRIRDYQLNEEDDDQKKKIKAAQLLVERIAERRLYTLVHSVKNYKQEDMTGERIEEAIVDLGEKELGKEKFEGKDIYVQIAQFDFGMKSENPLKELYVYTKQEPNKAVRFNRDMVSQLLLPKIFCERIVRVYCKAEDKDKKKDMKKAAEKWEEQLPKATDAEQSK